MKHQLEDNLNPSEVEDDRMIPRKSKRNGFYAIDEVNPHVINCSLAFIISLVLGILLLIALISATFQAVKDIKPTTSVTTVYYSLGLPDYESLSWEDIELRAQGQTVNFWMWDGDTNINAWVKGWLATEVKDLYEITLNLVENTGAADAIAQIAKERDEGITTEGTVDLIWINGENFYNGLTAGNLYGPWATKVPNAINFDFDSAAIAYDFGHSTNGYEMPYNSAQVVFTYDNATMKSPPMTVPEIVAWIKANPGKFTYAQPMQSDFSSYDFTGSVFIRQLFYYYCGPYTDFIGDYDETKYLQRASALFTVLREIEPYLYKANGAVYHPTNHTDVERLFAEGKIDFTLSYEPTRSAALANSGYWPETVRSYVLSSGTISNTNFVAIGYNAKNKLGAMVVGNFIASMQAQFSRKIPENWGALQCYDTSSTDFIEGGWQTAFEYITTYPQTPSVASLRAGRLTELDAKYTTRLQEDWQKCVIQYSTYKSTNTACG